MLQAFCENIFHVGPPGAGHVLKLVNNMLAMTMAAAIAEAVGGRRQERAVAREALRGGVRRRRQLGHLPDDGRPDARGRPRGLKFAIANAQKDLRYYTHLAEALPVPSFVAEAAHQSFVQAANLGLGDKFIASLFEAQERTAQVRIVD